MGKVVLDDAREVAKKLADDLDPRAVIVFGSVARNGEGNDLDLLVMQDENGKSRETLYEEVHRSLKEFYRRFAIDYFVGFTGELRERFLKGSPFLRLVQAEGRSLYMKDSVPERLDQAKRELAMAEYLFKGKYYRGTCLSVQQALEKAMKGMLIQKGWLLEKIHSLERLSAIGEEYNVNFEIPEDLTVLIDSMYRGRYPAEEGVFPTGEPSRAQAERLLTSAQSLFLNWRLA